MASKALLVAQREYLENVRTKTFWIGILAVPVVIVVAFAIGWVMNRSKEIKYYAVVDRTGTSLGEAVAQEAWASDRKTAADSLLDKNATTPEAVAEALAKAERELPPDSPLRPLVAELKQIPAGEWPAELELMRKGETSPRMVEASMRWMGRMSTQDWKKLNAEITALQTADKFRPTTLAELGVGDLQGEAQEKRLNELLSEGRLFAYFVLQGDVLHDTKDFRYVSNNLTDADLREWYARATTKVVQERRIADAGIAPEIAHRIQERIEFKEKKTGVGGATEDVKKSDTANKFAPVGFVYLLWIAVFTAAQMLLTNTVEEKSNRIIEVLLSSVSPLQLMSGKIWGIAATGLTLIGSWVAFALLAVWLAPVLISDFKFPLMAVIGDPLYLISFVAYFLAGYLLFAAMLVAIGSVCNSLKEAQNLLQPVFILLIVPMIAMFPVVQEPNGIMARVYTYIPIYTPFAMMNRASGPPPLWEYGVSSVIILVSVWFAFRAAGKVFRVGVLMTGKPPKLKEILGWLRAK